MSLQINANLMFTAGGLAVGRRRGQPHLGDDAPQGSDGEREAELARPGPGRDHDRVGRLEPGRRLDAGDAIAVAREPRTRTLEELRADGTLAEISEKYFGDDVTQ